MRSRWPEKSALILLLLLIVFLLSACLQASPIKSMPVKTIAIPAREHGYRQFDSQIIYTQAQLNDFINRISVVANPAWNNRDQFISAITEAAIDFSRDNLVLIRHTEGSGSVRLDVNEPIIQGGRVLFEIKRQAPAIRTADMAYYSFALVVAKAAASAVDIKIDNRPLQSLPIRANGGRTVPQVAVEGMIHVASTHDVKTTADRLEAVLTQKGMSVFDRIDHANGAAGVGVLLRPTELVIFGNPAIGGLLMQCQQTVAIDLPLKALVWSDEQSQVWLSYNDPRNIEQRHHIDGCDAVITKMAGALAAIMQAAADH